MPTISYDRPIYAPWLQETFQNGVLVNTSSGTGLMQHHILVRSWVRTPGYWSGVKNRTTHRNDLPMNDFYFNKIVVNHVYGGYVRREILSDDTVQDTFMSGAYYGAGHAPTVIPDGFAGPPLPAVDWNALEFRASSKSLLDLKDQKVNLVQAFAERQQTARLLSNTIVRFTASIKALKSGNFAGAANALGVKAGSRRIRKYKKSYVEDQSKAIADGWLELVYGWRPFISDIYGSAELIAQKTIREVRTRSRTRAKVDLMDVITKEDPSSYPRVSYYYQVKREVTISYTIYFSTPSESSHTLAQVGITNPLYIAWELTPWSFVVDWLMPIGTYLNTLDATKGLRFEKGCRTVFEKVTVYGKMVVGPTPQDPNVALYTGDSANYMRIDCVRSSLGDFPRVDLPPLKNPFSAEHLVNALALLRTSFTLKR